MSEEVVEKPDQFSPEWTPYVLSLLTKDEFKEDKPTAPGLKRVSNLIFGAGRISESQTVHHVSYDYAAVSITLTLDCNNIVGSAECSQDNTDEPYNKYPLATAQTRALSRAYKRLLGIDIITAEESSRKAAISNNVESDEEAGSITSTQVKFIDLLASKLGPTGVNVQAVVNQLHINKSISTPNVKHLSHADALIINETLDEMSKDTSKIHEELKGYDKNWYN